MSAPAAQGGGGVDPKEDIVKLLKLSKRGCVELRTEERESKNPRMFPTYLREFLPP